MARVTLEYCALYYLNWWLSHDHRYCTALNTNNQTQQLEALRDAATAYRVGRNLQLKYDQDAGIPRLKPALDAVMATSPEEIRDEERLIPAIMKVRDAVAGAYGDHDVLSLTTKFLWLRFKHPVIIFDGNVREALMPIGRDLKEFYAKWRELYALKREEIRAVSASLETVHRFCVDPSIKPTEVRALAELEWFQERIFDTYLWHVGGSVRG